MKSFVIILCAIIGASLALPEKSGPYPAKGWKPQGARLELPTRKYGTPRNADDVQITTSANEYLSPTTVDNRSDDDVLSVQGLPSADAKSQFKDYQAPARQQTITTSAFVGHPLLLSPQFAPANERIQERQFNGQQQVQTSEDSQNNVQPARAYGASDLPVNRNNQEQPQSENDDNDEDESDEQTIAVSSVVSGDGEQGQVGQYYLLLPDNSLQKVRFATKQTEEDREINGFSAQLRYSPVEAIKDPVYGLDEQGKLVRLYK